MDDDNVALGNDADDSYDELVVKEPERPVDVTVTGRGKSLTEAEHEAPNLSDLQSTLNRIFPKCDEPEIDNLQFSRLSPDMFIPMMRIQVNSAIKTADLRKPLNVPMIVARLYTPCSIGLDGKGRIDAIELAGAAKETDELDKLGKRLGFD